MSKKRDSAEQFVADAFTIALQKPSYGKEQLVIWGGDFASDQLPTFLAQWGDTLARLMWHIVVQPSKFLVLRSSPPPTQPEQINRLHLFGETGDLLIRRDEDRFFWRFIGLRSADWPQPDDADDFWVDHANTSFIAVESSYIQWRKGDDRTGLDLSDYFPDIEGGDTDPNIVLRQVHYLDQGRLAFVRSIGLEVEGE